MILLKLKLIVYEVCESEVVFQVEGGFLGVVGFIDVIYVCICVFEYEFDVYINWKKFYLLNFQVS